MRRRADTVVAANEDWNCFSGKNVKESTLNRRTLWQDGDGSNQHGADGRVFMTRGGDTRWHDCDDAAETGRGGAVLALQKPIWTRHNTSSAVERRQRQARSERRATSEQKHNTRTQEADSKGLCCLAAARSGYQLVEDVSMDGVSPWLHMCWHLHAKREREETNKTEYENTKDKTGGAVS